MAKYQRHPEKYEIGETPIPNFPGEILHIDIYSTDKKFFLTCLDKFSEFDIVKPIPSRAIIEVKPALIEILNFFKQTKTIICDNEKSLTSEIIKKFLEKYFEAKLFKVP